MSNTVGNREQERHTQLWHIKLCPVTPATDLLGRGPGQKIYVPWDPKIAHQSLTPGHPTGRLHPHRKVTGQQYLYLCSFSFPDFLQVLDYGEDGISCILCLGVLSGIPEKNLKANSKTTSRRLSGTSLLGPLSRYTVSR